MLLAVLNWDIVSGAVKWLPGATLIPTPTSGNTITWSPNSQQLGRGANKITMDGGTGNVTIPGTVTTNNDVVINEFDSSGRVYGRVMSADRFHAIILRGDIDNVANNYTIAGQQPVTTFLQYGGTYKFKQVTEAINTLVFEVTPTHVNIPTSLRVGGYTAGIRPFVSCAVNATTAEAFYSNGQQTASVTRHTQAGTIGYFKASWTNPHPNGSNYVPQYSTIHEAGFVWQVGRTSTYIIIACQTAVEAYSNIDFWLTIH